MADLIICFILFWCASSITTACTNPGDNNMVEKVVAQVVLKASNGSSVLDADPELVVIDKQRIEEASDKLKAIGCDVLVPGTHSLSVSCDKDVFEKVFQTSLQSIESPITAITESFFQSSQPVKIPDDLKPWVADVLLPIPPGLDP